MIGIDASRVIAETENGTVILRGEVSSYFTGRRSAKTMRQESLFDDPDNNLRDIEVVVSAGTVTLRRTVKACWKKGHAEDIVVDEPGAGSRSCGSDGIPS